MADGKKLLHSLRYPILLGLLIPAVMLGVGMAGGKNEESPVSAGEETVDTEAFRADAAQRLQELLQGIEGVGEVRVMITVESTPAKVYAEDVESSYEKNETEYTGSSQSKTVFSQEGGQEKTPVLLYRLMPKIGGVAVVCEGAKDPGVCLKITRLVSGLFGIGTNRVCVTN